MTRLLYRDLCAWLHGCSSPSKLQYTWGHKNGIDFYDYPAHFSHSPHIGLVIFHHCTLMFLFHLYYPHLPRILIVGLYPRAKHHSHSCDFISCAVTKTMGINFLRAEGYNSKGYLILSEYSWKKQSLNQGTDVGILCIIYRAVAHFLYAWDQPCPTQVC